MITSCEATVLVRSPVNKKGFWRLRGRGMSLDIKAAALRARRHEENTSIENTLIETGALYMMSMETATPKPSTPPATRRPTFVSGVFFGKIVMKKTRY